MVDAVCCLQLILLGFWGLCNCFDTFAVGAYWHYDWTTVDCSMDAYMGNAAGCC